ncbi:MAG: sigma-70 family RNA polymerase sigma factor [Rhodospirillales bacterium]|nr:MAG: sigma-70 family RNA polymerase sigma factor [Rhodospirillales bacterium]
MPLANVGLRRRGKGPLHPNPREPTLSVLYDEAARHPLLARDEECELARRAEAGDGEAVHRLVGSHLRFVIKIARSYRGMGLPMTELVQQGALGLVQAVRRFDPDQGVRLSTFAMWSIRAAIQNHVLASWSLVRAGTGNAQKTLVLKLKRMAQDLRSNGGRLNEDLIAAMARRFGVATGEVGALARRIVGGDASLDHVSGAGVALADRLASDEATPEQQVVAARQQWFLSQALAKALGALSPRERLVIQRRYLDDVKPTFAAIGRDLGVSKDRVRQLESRALRKLRELLNPALADLR